MNSVGRAIIIACGLSLVLLAATSDAASIKALIGANIVGLDGQAAVRDGVVLIEDDTIAAVGAAGDVNIPAGAEVIDVGGTWLIPGLMNMHVHLGLVLPGNMAAELANETEGELTLRMAAVALEALQAGVTTIRLPGEQRHGDLALKKAIARGQAHGPRIYSSGEALVITGGHGSDESGEYSDGPYELMKAARREISAGASWVKILISGGISTATGDISMPLMTPEEINAVVDAAHRFGAKVAAHSGSSAATSVAIDAGVDSIEHGYLLDRAVLRKMKKNGTWYVPTIVVSQPATQPFFEKIGSPEWYLERRDSVGKEHWRALVMAVEEGVKIALGTDQLPSEPNDGTTATAREAQYYVEAGMTPLQALRAATIEPAKMLGDEALLGSIDAGKYADIVAVDRNPADDITALRNILFVMKGGTVYRNDLER